MSTTELPPSGVDDEATEVFDDDVVVILDDTHADDTHADDATSTGDGADRAGPAPDGAAPVGVVDPRMRERWVAQRREQGQRRLRLLVAVVVTVSVLVLAYVIARSPLLGAHTVRVEGATKTPATAVRAAAGISDGEPLLFLDTGAIVRRVERLPYVATASVSTDLPHTVTVRVVERTPVAFIAGPAGASLLDRTGRVLEQVPTRPDGLTEVTGTTRPGAAGTRVSDPEVFRGLGDFPPALRLLAGRVRVRGGEAVVVVRGDAPLARTIRLGPLVDVRAKAAAVLAVLADLGVRGEHVRYVDVRVPDAPATA